MRVISEGRLIGLDYLRGFVIVLVVLHHSVLAYCWFGHFDTRHYLWSSAPIVDAHRWLGFDLIVLFNDSYFMPLMFLVSGLFVWPSLRRKGGVRYLADRVRRLGVPFAIAVLTFIPLAYYPSFRMTGSDASFASFWAATIFTGPWPSGPPWFLAVLLGFDFLAAAAHVLLGRLRLPPPPDVLRSFAALATVSLVVYLPLLIRFGPSLWLAWGPFMVQASRTLLYAVYFAVGVRAGADRLAEPIPGGPVRWTVLALGLFGLEVAVQAARIRSPAVLPPVAGLLLYGLTLALFCAAATRALLAVFQRFRRHHAAWDNLSANAFGIYLLHYPFVLWGQYGLLGQDLGAIPKAALVFAGALALSWASAAALRRVVPL